MMQIVYDVTSKKISMYFATRHLITPTTHIHFLVHFNLKQNEQNQNKQNEIQVA
jgi:hypothetical protein